MPVELWAAFAAASLVLLLIPGPTILLIVSYGLGHGRRSVAPLSIGAALGDVTAMTLSMLGVGALMAASAAVFTAVKWAGAAYLVWLGVKMWRDGGRAQTQLETPMVSRKRMLLHAWLVTALNPKALTFFIAFMPQFISPDVNFWLQMAVLEAIFVVIAGVVTVGYGLAAARAGAFVRNPRALRWVNRIGGSCMIGAGAAAVTARA